MLHMLVAPPVSHSAPEVQGYERRVNAGLLKNAALPRQHRSVLVGCHAGCARPAGRVAARVFLGEAVSARRRGGL